MKRFIYSEYTYYDYFCSVIQNLNNMKKFILLLLAGLLFAPSEILAEKYNSKRVASAPHHIKSPDQYYIGFYLNEYTGDMAITPVTSISSLTITLTGTGGTYINTTVSLGVGQSYTNCLDFLPLGTYLLTMSTASGVIDQYEITVEPD